MSFIFLLSTSVQKIRANFYIGKEYPNVLALKSGRYYSGRGLTFVSSRVEVLIFLEAIFLTHYRLAMPFGNRKKYFSGSFQFIIAFIKKNHPSGNLKFNYLGIFQSLKLRISTEKILSISLKLNFTPNTLGR